MNKRAVGKEWEDAACEYLKLNGVSIEYRNFKGYRGGEIDIIGRDKEGVLIFAEVKYRKNPEHGFPAEAVTARKIRSICRTADLYRAFRRTDPASPVRFDVISITGSGDISWLKNAFDYVY